jgi:hypothetical protein
MGRKYQEGLIVAAEHSRMDTGMGTGILEGNY